MPPNFGATQLVPARDLNAYQKPRICGAFLKRMMGLEPTTFCMANASDVRARSRPLAQTASCQRFRPGDRTRANPSERRTLPFLPRIDALLAAAFPLMRKHARPAQRACG